MSSLNIGDQAPDFTLPSNGDKTISLSDFKGEKVVLYFYPKDNTPGCTTESCDFRDNMKAFEALNAKIIGVSKCSVKKHDNFVAKQNLNFPLVSDENSDLCERYGVWKEKSMYGKKYFGISRSTFMIDSGGGLFKQWSDVKVSGHVKEVLETAKNCP